MKSLFLFVLFFFTACANLPQEETFAERRGKFLLTDRSGEFLVVRTVKIHDSNLVVKREVFAPNESKEPLEKTISVSKVGKIKTKKGFKKGARPEVAQQAIWYEKNKFFSQSKINPADKTLNVIMKSPENKWNGEKSFSFPKGNVFCYFSQLPECVKLHGFLSMKEKKPYRLHVVWDSYPYHQEMYSNVSETPFESATWAFDKKTNDGYRFGLLLNGQLVIYEFDADFEFKNMFWVVQGISLSKQKD